MFTYKITDISKSDNWIYIQCNEEDSTSENNPFIELVKHIAKKWNNNEWQGRIFSVGELRYKVKNDPIDLIYQWDDLFGIVFEYTNKTSLNGIRSFIADNYNIR